MAAQISPEDQAASIYQRFFSWAINENPKPAYVLPEVSIQGKKIDLVCVEEPELHNIAGPGSDLIRRYRRKCWPLMSEPERRRRLGLDKQRFNRIATQLVGKKIWLVELKEGPLTSEALGQILVYRFHFQQMFRDLTIQRSLIACRRTDAVVEKVCSHCDNIEVVPL